MPLFICDRCKCVDNTATSDFWLQARLASTERLCTECRTGTWHDRFPDSLVVDGHDHLDRARPACNPISSSAKRFPCLEDQRPTQPILNVCSELPQGSGPRPQEFAYQDGALLLS